MPILAALIARGTVVLAEYSPPGLTFPSIARRLCSQIPSSPDSKNSYNYEGHNFNYLVEGGLTFICMTDQEMKLRIPYAFLFDISNRFKATYKGTIATASTLQMNDTFSRILRDRIDFFSNDRNADKITKVKGEIEDAKSIMVKNIDKVLERGDRIEMLVQKTEDMNIQSHTFKKKSTQLKTKMFWQNVKLCIVLIVVISILVLGGVGVLLWKLGVFDGTIHHILHPSSTSTSTGDLTTGDLTTGTTTGETTVIPPPTPPPAPFTTGTTTGELTTAFIPFTTAVESLTTAQPFTTGVLSTADLSTGDLSTADLSTGDLSTGVFTTGKTMISTGSTTASPAPTSGVNNFSTGGLSTTDSSTSTTN